MLENREISIVCGREEPVRAVGEGLWPQARHVRYREVRHRRSTEEGVEQGWSSSTAAAPEGRPVTEGNSEKTDCDLHAEAGVSIERT